VVCSGSGSDGQGAIGSGGRHEMMTGTARLAREGIALWPARPEEGGGTLLSHQWRTRRGDREQRVREIVKRERARGGRALGLSLLLEQGGRGGAHARARGSHTACSSCVQSDDGAAPEAFNIDKKSTESPNFSPLYLPISCCSGSNFLTKSCRTICGEQLCLNYHGLVRHGYEDTSLQSRVYETKN